MSFTSPSLNSFTTAQAVEKINVTTIYGPQFIHSKIYFHLDKGGVNFTIYGDYFFVEIDIIIFATISGLKNTRHQLYILAKSLNKTLAFVPVFE